MGRGMSYYSLEVFLAIVDAFVSVLRVDGGRIFWVVRLMVAKRMELFAIPRENWLLRQKAEMVCHEKVVKMPWNYKVRVGSNGNLLGKASVLLGRKKSG
ncbi:hypothetical protein Tco_1284614 [Tanacetum coccineum]